MCRIFITTSDIAALEGLSTQRASEIMRIIMDSYKKERPNKLTIAEYCKYRGINETEVTQQIKSQS